MKIALTSRDIVVIGLCSALYAVFGILTGGFTFFGIGFLPAVIIPAIFAALYGSWVGGVSGAIGIFVRDVYVHGNPLLSLVAGVPANFILFFLIGYIYTKNISLKQTLTIASVTITGLLIASIGLLSDIEIYTGLSVNMFLLAFILTIIVSLAAVIVISIRWKEWRSYTLGAIVGQIAGGLLLSVTVWLVSPLFLGYFVTSLSIIYVIPLFVWLIITELPFILMAAPIIKIVQKSFPTIYYLNKASKGGTADKKNS